MKKILIFLILLSFINLNVHAVEFDTSIDAGIRKNYNLDGAEETLPSLPNAAPSSYAEVPLNTNNKATGKVYTLKGGTKVTLSSQRAITDYTPRGTKVSFVSQNNIYAKDGTVINAGTLFKGTVTDSHPPQITGNGGLIELKIDEIYHNGVMSPITTKVSMANSRKVFLSDIKGKRKYWSNTAKMTTPGKKVFRATKGASSSMYMIPFVNLVAFVPITIGSVFYILNATVAPVIAIFSKGGSISLPAGTKFEIKIKGDTEIRG